MPSLVVPKEEFEENYDWPLPLVYFGDLAYMGSTGGVIIDGNNVLHLTVDMDDFEAV